MRIQSRPIVRTAGLGLALCASVVAAQQAVRTGKTRTGIAYDTRGTGSVVVLITGSNLDRRMWAREAEWLAKDHTVVRYDLRAHGESDGATAPFSNLGDFHALLDELQINTAALIGISAGSTIALDAALETPERFNRIVLAGPSVSGYVSREQPPFVSDLMTALRARDYKKAGEVLLATPVFAVPPGSQSIVRQMVMENDRLWTVPREFLVATRPAIDRLEHVKVPTLVLVGENDSLQREQADLLAKQIPGARLVIVPGGGHLLNLTSPAAFESAVRDFLQ
ncbi:MAG TPA: alpha/beta fold hydrolase [Vicinamibacterales bacterium]